MSEHRYERNQQARPLSALLRGLSVLVLLVGSYLLLVTSGEAGSLGDASCDGQVSSVDAALVLQLEAGLVQTLPCGHAADVNIDGAVSAVDAALILQFTAGLVPEFGNCDAAYPTLCLPSPPPDLNCADVPYQDFTVLPPDPHGFDGDADGVGCES